MLTSSTPTSAQRSAVRFWLQAMVSMPNACPTVATSAPMLPSPQRPSVWPCRSVPTVVIQPPPRTLATSVGSCRAQARISAQVSSAVLCRAPPVPHTVTPWSRQAAMSIAALRGPVVTSSRRSPRRSSTERVNAVRSRMATTIGAPASAATSCASSARCSSWTTSSMRSPSDAQSP